MYGDLLEIWKNELKTNELTKLPKDFVQKVAEYLKEIDKESKMLDKKTVKASLLNIEALNIKRMLNEIMRIRRHKLIKKALRGEKISELLSFEEEFYSKLAPLLELHQESVRNVLMGRGAATKIEHKYFVLRFLAEIPEIIGSDMKVYGPFKAEDVAVLPVENAKIFVKQGLAVSVEIC
ncbi:MAG: hypothetical protein QXK93_07350 [Candidatus Bathyarchaeia archaeon]|nr:hypothetical protein [Candidatus Bathyarchaeota archaeon]